MPKLEKHKSEKAEGYAGLGSLVCMAQLPLTQGQKS